MKTQPYSLYFLFENITNGYNTGYLDLISLISIVCCLLIIMLKNPITSVLFLIGLFFSISCYLMMLGINYIGLSYLLVYVGAVSILFLFILMLINVRISELSSNTSNSLPLAILTIIFFYYFIEKAMPFNPGFSHYIYDSLFIDTINNINNFELWLLSNDFYSGSYIYYVTSNNWDSNLSEISHIGSIGNIIYTSYSMWLILTSEILLLAMVGAIIITIRQKK